MRSCYFCGSREWIERHHVFGGALKKKSELYGMIADLCHYCHNEPPDGVHFNRERRKQLQAAFQRKFEQEHPDIRFQDVFYKNYI